MSKGKNAWYVLVCVSLCNDYKQFIVKKYVQNNASSKALGIFRMEYKCNCKNESYVQACVLRLKIETFLLETARFWPQGPLFLVSAKNTAKNTRGSVHGLML